MSVVRHIAAHIRHDEMRLLKTAGVSPLVACDCGVAMGSPMGYIYHIFHDHVFERKKFSDLAATIVSFLTLIVETAIESVLAVRVDFRATKWTLWCAYFALENDEGDESLFIDSTDLNEHWWKLWESLLDECMTGKKYDSPMTRSSLFEECTRLSTKNVFGLGSTNRFLLWMQTRFSARFQRLVVWLYLNQWTNDPVNRVHLASESRWIRLAQIRRRVFLDLKKGEQGQSDSWRTITVCTIPSSFEFKQRQIPPVANQSSPAVVPGMERRTKAVFLFCYFSFFFGFADSDVGSSASVAANDSNTDVLDACPQEADAATESDNPMPTSGFFADLLAASANSCQVGFPPKKQERTLLRLNVFVQLKYRSL
ncbi:hypothetical protein COOONC_11202 [Cooperia oncophora]